jgi:hypothetical protein
MKPTKRQSGVWVHLPMARLLPLVAETEDFGISVSTAACDKNYNTLRGGVSAAYCRTPGLDPGHDLRANITAQHAEGRRSWSRSKRPNWLDAASTERITSPPHERRFCQRPMRVPIFGLFDVKRCRRELWRNNRFRQFDVNCHRLAGSGVAADFEPKALATIKAAKSCASYGRDVNENITSWLVDRYESIPSCFLPKLHNSKRHLQFSDYICTMNILAVGQSHSTAAKGRRP